MRAYEGYGACDSHQQEEERLRVEFERDGLVGLGRLGRWFGSTYAGWEDLRYVWVPFVARRATDTGALLLEATNAPFAAPPLEGRQLFACLQPSLARTGVEDLAVFADPGGRTYLLTPR